MEILYGIIIAISWIFFTAIIRSLTTLFHELGHAIPSLVFSDQNVVVYIGSYGDLKDSYSFNFGRLKINFKFNFFDWKLGMCSGVRTEKMWQTAIILLGGPLASVMIAFFFLFLIFSNGSNQILLFLASTFTVAAILDFFVNVIPSKSAIQMHDGGVTYNDGEQLVNLVSRSMMSSEYLEIEKLYQDEKYDEVAEKGYALIQKGNQPRQLYNLVLSSFVELKQNKDAIIFYKIIKGTFELEEKDYYLIGKIYENMNNYPEAVKYFDHYLHHSYTDFEALNRRGKVQLNQSNYELAALDFESSIQYSEGKYAEAFSNLGLAFLRLDEIDDALNMLEEAQKLDPTIPEIYYHLGLYYEKKGNDQLAILNYKKAKEMNVDYHGIDYKIDILES